MATPASKRQRLDPHALDDDTLPAKGESVLGKRHRVQDNQYFYNNQQTKAVMRGDPNQSHSQHERQDEQSESKEADIAMGGASGGGGGSGSGSGSGMFDFFNSTNDDGGNDNGGNNSNGFNSGWINPPIKFVRGGWVDVQINESDGNGNVEAQWMCGVMTKDLGDKVEIHVPRQGIQVILKTSPILAPVGTHTEGFS